MSSEAPKRRGRPPRSADPARQPLSRDRVLAAALVLVDRDGIEGLSMRRLAHALGVEAMSLYNHVADKDDLLDAMTELVVAEIDLPDPALGWRAAMRTRSISARAALRRHPWLAVVMESRQAGPVRLALYESMLAALRGGGFSLGLTHRAMLALDSHLYGFALQEAAWPLRTAAEVAEVAEAFAAAWPQEQYPYLRELLLEQVVHTGPADEGAFAFGLDLILDGLERARRAEARASSQT